MLNSSGDSGHPCLVRDFTRNASNISLLSEILVFRQRVCVCVCVTMLRKKYINSCLSEFLSGRVLNFVKSFKISVQRLMQLFLLDLAMWYIILTN